MIATNSATKFQLYGWVESFAEGKRPILALLFGEMVRRATPIMQQYQSDLFHDALWLNENVTGETSFDFLIRPCGTNLSIDPDPNCNSALISAKMESAGSGAVLYKVELVCDGGMWSAWFMDQRI